MAALKTIVGLEYSHLWHAAVADNLHLGLAARVRLRANFTPQ